VSGQCITRQQLEDHEMLVQHGSIAIFYLPLNGVELRGSGCATRQTYMHLKYFSASGRVGSGWVAHPYSLSNALLVKSMIYK
jgi:hypothetical protein